MSPAEYLVVTLATFAALNGILVLGLNLQFGTAGILNLAYIAIVAVGAYAAGLAELPPAPAHSLSVQYVGGFGWPVPLAILFGVAAATAFTFVLGGLAFLRLREDYLGLTLFAVQSGLLLITTNYQPLLDGSRGLLGLQGPLQDSLSPAAYELLMFGVCVAALIVVFVAVRRIDKSPFGRALRALREDELAVASMGRDPWRLKVQAFIVGGAIAGLGGALFAIYVGGWGPGAWQPGETLALFAAIFVGGRGRPLGVLVGSVIVLEVIGQASLFLPDIAGRPDLLPALQQIVAVVLLLAFLWWRPRGMLPEQKEFFGEAPELRPARSTDGAGTRSTT